MKLLSPFLFLILISTCYQANAVVYNWQGGTGLWQDANNWNPVGIPSTGDIVYISNGHAKIQNGTSVQINSIAITPTGTLTVRKTASLTADAEYLTQIVIQGTLIVFGELNGIPAGLAPDNNIGIESQGILDIKIGGKVYLENFQDQGISSFGKIRNRGNIRVNGFHGGNIAIYIRSTTGQLKNYLNGNIFIYDITGTGIHLGSAGLGAGQLFENFGDISITSPQLQYGIIQVTADFHNYGTTYITGPSSAGIKIGASLELLNEGSIEVQGNAQPNGYGINLDGFLNNTINGTVHIHNSLDIGLYLGSSGVIDNYNSFIIFGNMDIFGISNLGTINNYADFKVKATLPFLQAQINNAGHIENGECGYVFQTEKLTNKTTGTIINHGFWVTVHPGYDSFHAPFTNHGVYANPYGYFFYQAPINTGYIIEPIAGTHCHTSTITNAFQIGLNPLPIPNGLYIDTDYSSGAGIYDETVNEISFYASAIDSSTLYLEFINSTGSCSQLIPIGFTTPIQGGIELCGDGIDNDCDGLIDEAGCLAPIYSNQEVPMLEKRAVETVDLSYSDFDIFPNPSTSDLNIRLSPNAGALEAIQVYNINGILIWKGTNTKQMPNLASGLYWIQVQTATTISQPKKWLVQQ